MKKGCFVIFFFWMALGNSTFLFGQQADSVYLLPRSYHPITPFVVNAFPPIPRPLGMPGDTLLQPIGLLDVSYGKRVLEVYIDRDWKYISFTEYVDDRILRLPFISSVEWYFNHMLQVNRQVKFIEAIKSAKATEDRSQVGGRDALEVVGVDLGQFGRASLRVRGNVNISGKMVFQDQELVRASINETQNTHIEFDQKQNLNIEGKIGDRITVKMDQDSERDFDWENNIRISYKGKEDDIVQEIQAGNISLSLPSTQYVTFSGKNKGLFGLKAISRLGPVDITTIASIEQTRKERQKYKGGKEAQTQSIKDYEYVKNQYFFVHEWYRTGIDTPWVEPRLEIIQIPPFYPLKEGLHPIGNIKVKNFELYRSDVSNNPNADPGIAYPDPNNTEADSLSRNFIRLERGIDYFLSEDLGFIRLRTRARPNEIIACHYDLAKQEGDTLKTLISIGRGITADDSTLVLKMLKSDTDKPTDATGILMFRNVYYLGASNINKEGFAVRIINDRITPPSDRDPQGVVYLTQFGLDSLNENGVAQADELVDKDNPNIVNLVNGELIFPAYYPFANADSLPGGNANPALKDMLGPGLMYTTTIRQDITADSRFKIEADYSNPSSEIRLGFMLVEGSEEVYVNSDLMTKGKDYQIDYFSGTIVLDSKITENPNANIEILYDKHELVSFDKKVILGTRAQMDLGHNSFIGATALYYNQSVINEKIEVGYEPIRNFIWDLNGRYELALEGLSRAIDKLPLLETDRESSFSVEGEIARVLPNPNPINNPSTGDNNGVAYIDDFEGAKRTTNPPVQRRFWRESSAPLDLLTGANYSQFNRAAIYWYNPYSQVPTKKIWPNLSTSIRAQNETTDILVLRYKTRSHQHSIPRDSIWNGITTSFYSGDFDQTQSKFFEIWLRKDSKDYQKNSDMKLTVDLGKISEDWNGNGKLDTEDIPESGMTLGNGFLEDEEDTGLDGCMDEYEDGWGGCLTGGNTYQELLQLEGTDSIINISADVDPTDPNGDNWSYTEGSSDYRKVNGTEGNGTGNRIQEGGKYPDTEDLDRSGFIDPINDYFSKTITLNDTTYLAGETIDGGKLTGWRLYRIPLSHFKAVKDIDWNEIRYLRLVVSNVDSQAVLEIAKIELVGNDWQEMGVTSDSSSAYTKNDSIFAVTVINTDDNADYDPPKGVKGEYDRINEIRSKEQSLVLKFNGLPAGQKAAAKKSLIALTGNRAKSYLTYDRMKMFVYGNSPWIDTDRTDIEMFIRFGFGNDYYELTQPVYREWDETENRNTINIDLNWLAKLKLQDSTSVKKIRSTDIFFDSLDVRRYFFTDDEGALTGKRIEIKGSPALSRIQYFIIGVKNTSIGSVDGEIWVDELRLSGVKKDRGMAMRVQSKFNLADIGNVSVSFSRKDADFHVLQQRLGSNNSSENLRVNTTLNLHKFLPKAWTLSVPLSTSFSNSISRPKYFPGTDILVDWDNATEDLDSIASISRSINLSTSIAKAGKSDNRLIKYTVDNLKGNFSTTRSFKSNETMKEVRSETYTGKLTYSLNFGRDNYIEPLKWMNFLPWFGNKISILQLFYTPSSFTTSMDINEKLIQKQSRAGSKSPDDYDLGLNRTFNLDYRLTNNINTKYNRSAKSDMDNYRGYAWMAVRDLDPGIVTSTTENLSTSYTPEFLSWLKPNFNYSAGYRWVQPRGSAIDGADIGTQLRFSTSLSLNLTTIMELFYKPTTGQRPKAPQRSLPGQNRPDTDPQEKKREDKPVLKFIYGIVKKVNPLSLNYSQNLNRTSRGVQGIIPRGYRFGWLPDHGMPYDTVRIGINTGTWDFKRDFSSRSGLKLTRNISLGFNYSQNISVTRSGSGVEQQSFSRDVFAIGEKLENPIPFFSWSFRISGVEKWPILNKFVRSASLEHAFSGKESYAWQFEGGKIPEIKFFKLSDFIDSNEENQRSARVNTSFSPLVGFSMTLKKGVSFDARFNLTKSVEEAHTGLTVRSDTTFTASANYSHRGGFTIPLPMMEDIKIQNTINFNLSYDWNVSQTKGTKDKTTLAEQAYNSKWSIKSRISYSFSSRVSGGIIYEYRESETRTSGRNIDRDFGFDINIAISG